MVKKTNKNASNLKIDNTASLDNFLNNDPYSIKNKNDVDNGNIFKAQNVNSYAALLQKVSLNLTNSSITKLEERREDILKEATEPDIYSKGKIESLNCDKLDDQMISSPTSSQNDSREFIESQSSTSSLVDFMQNQSIIQRRTKKSEHDILSNRNVKEEEAFDNFGNSTWEEIFQREETTSDNSDDDSRNLIFSVDDLMGGFNQNEARSSNESMEEITSQSREVEEVLVTLSPTKTEDEAIHEEYLAVIPEESVEMEIDKGQNEENSLFSENLNSKFSQEESQPYSVANSKETSLLHESKNKDDPKFLDHEALESHCTGFTKENHEEQKTKSQNQEDNTFEVQFEDFEDDFEDDFEEDTVQPSFQRKEMVVESLQSQAAEVDQKRIETEQQPVQVKKEVAKSPDSPSSISATQPQPLTENDHTSELKPMTSNHQQSKKEDVFQEQSHTQPMPSYPQAPPPLRPQYPLYANVLPYSYTDPPNYFQPIASPIIVSKAQSLSTYMYNPLFLPQHGRIHLQVSKEMLRMQLHALRNKVEMNKRELIENDVRAQVQKYESHYTTLEDTKTFIAKHRRKPITLEEAERIVEERERHRI